MKIEEIEKKWLDQKKEELEKELMINSWQSIWTSDFYFAKLLAVAEAAKEMWEYDEYGVTMTLAASLEELEKD